MEFLEMSWGKHGTGLLIITLVIISLMLLLQWVMWLFNLGRFKSRVSEDDPTVFVLVSSFFNKIINEFRHLLALLIFLIFAFILGLILINTASLETINPTDKLDLMKDGLQAVVASMGGLLGSIIGYYFGESSAKAQVIKDTESSHDEKRVDLDGD